MYLKKEIKDMKLQLEGAYDIDRIVAMENELRDQENQA